MIPYKLTLQGFLSYRKPVTLDFTSFDVACISGSNGAGKSSLLDAITWALFGEARKRDESIINVACQKAEVMLEFEYEGNLYRVQRINQRGKSTTVDFFIKNPLSDDPLNQWKTLSERTLRDTDALIQRTLRLDYTTFINASFFLQGKADLFTTQRPADRKRILSSILGLDIWETYKDKAAALRKDHENDLAGIEARLVEVRAELGEEDARIAQLEALEKELQIKVRERQTQAQVFENLKKLTASLLEQERLLATLKDQLERATKTQQYNAAILKTRQAELAELQNKVVHAEQIEADYQKWLADRKTLEGWEELAAQFRLIEVKRQEPLMAIESARVQLNEKLSALKERFNTLLLSEKELPTLTAQLTEKEKTIRDIKLQIAERVKIEEALGELRQKHADAKAENPRLRDEMNLLKERIEKLEEAEGASCPLCGQPLSEEDRLALVTDLTQQGLAMGARFRDNKALISEFEVNLRDLESRLSAAKELDSHLIRENRLLDQVAQKISHIEGERQTWQNQYSQQLEEIESTLEQGNFAQEARSTLGAIDQALKDMGYDPGKHESARQVERAGRQAETAYNDLNKAKATLKPLQREVLELEQTVARQESDVARLQVAFDEADTQYNQTKAQLPNLQEAETALLQIQERENRLRMAVGAARQKVDVLDTLRQREAIFLEERESTIGQISHLKVLEKSFGKDGVPALLIEQALPEIEEQANTILSRLSNNTMSVQLITQREFKDQSREDKKETLDIRISDGSGARDYEMFSGGEAFRINFAIRLALSRVLAQRSGARLQTLVIDEGFGNQDQQGRQRLIEAINLIKADFQKILIITHLDELKESFPTRIEVEKTVEGSALTVI